MWRRIVVIALAAAMTIGISARAATRTVSWQAVTTYTDGSMIEQGNTISYSCWRQDSVTLAYVRLADHTVLTTATFDDGTLVAGRVYLFTAQAHALWGGDSAISAPYSWTVPFPPVQALPMTPVGLDVR
jgi:hypothetical protein